MLIARVAGAWGVAYLALGSPVGILPFLYPSVSLGSLATFSRTRRLDLLLAGSAATSS